jgi:thiamine transporter ThiT
VIGLFLVLLLLLSATIGLPYAAIAFAIAFPLAMSEGRMRWVASACAGALVAVVALWLLDYYMGVLWPEPVFAEWVRAYL